MNDQGFVELMKSLRWMGRYMRGEEADGRTIQIPDPDVKAIRETTGLSQSQFALMIGITVKPYLRPRLRFVRSPVRKDFCCFRRLNCVGLFIEKRMPLMMHWMMDSRAGFLFFADSGLCNRCTGLCASNFSGLDHGKSILHRHHAPGHLSGMDGTGLDRRFNLGHGFG